MTEESEFTGEQLKFLELFHIAAQYDCLYILDFYCMDEFDHDRILNLTDEERALLADRAQREIFAHAIEHGFRPTSSFGEVRASGYLC